MGLPTLYKEKIYNEHQFIDQETIDRYYDQKYNEEQNNFLDNPLDFQELKYCLPMKKHFLNKSLYNSIHGIRHTLRVIIAASILAKNIGLSKKNTTELQYASGFHDVRRINDNLDYEHSIRAADFFMHLDITSGINKNKISEAIFYHNQFIEVSLEEKSLIYLLKQADAIERFRFPKKKWRANEDILNKTFNEQYISLHKKLIYLSEKTYLQNNNGVKSVCIAATKLGILNNYV